MLPAEIKMLPFPSTENPVAGTVIAPFVTQSPVVAQVAMAVRAGAVDNTTSVNFALVV